MIGLQQSMSLEKGFSWIRWSLQENSNNGPGGAEENLEGFRVKPAAISCSLWGPGCLTAPYHIPPDPNVPQLGGSALLQGKPSGCWHPWGATGHRTAAAWVLRPARPGRAPQPGQGAGYFGMGGAKAKH